MGTSDATRTLRRIDQWLGEQWDGVFERRQRLEATYCEWRAARAEDRGDLDAAEEYYDRARSLRGRLGDRDAAIDLGMSHATVAHENGSLGVARKQYERVVELRAREANAAGALDALEPLLDILDAEGDDEDLREWWGHAMMVLGKADAGEIEAERRDRLVDRYAEKIRTEDSAGRLYGFAVQRLLEAAEEDPDGGLDRSDDEARKSGAELLDATWERRDVVRESVGQFPVVLAAGVGLVALAEFTDREVDREEILAVVADHRDRLSEPATVLFDRLADGETEVDPEAFRRDLDLDEANELGDVESELFGLFLEELE